MRKCHRIVILPEYQGIGLGTKFLATVAEFYKNEGFDFRIRTTLKNFSRSLVKSGMFICLGANISKENKSIMKSFKNRCRKVKAVSLKYIGESMTKARFDGSKAVKLEG